MNRAITVISSTAFVAALLLLILFGPASRPQWWFTPDQRADRLFRQEKFAEAARASGDPARQGAALYREGNFKEAAVAFARDGSAAGAFNRGNALVMQGKYDDAIKSYNRALSLRPQWTEASENRALAVARRDRMKFEGDATTGADEKPDEVVFEKGRKQAGETVQVDAGQSLSDDQLQAMWLKRVQTKPADFLRAKFAFQLADQEADGDAK